MDTAEAKPLRKISRVLNEPNDNRGEYKATGFSSTCARYASGRVEQVDAQVPRQEVPCESFRGAWGTADALQ
eukprot:337008-Pyramimonas_sp.AAC.2